MVVIALGWRGKGLISRASCARSKLAVKGGRCGVAQVQRLIDKIMA